MIFGIFFASWRLLEILTLIPIIGMLSYFVQQYNSANALTPTSILVLFIVSILAAAWAIYTLFTYHRSRSNAFFVGFIDLCFVGAFIAGVYELRGINNDNCSSLSQQSYSYTGYGLLSYSLTLGGYALDINKTCAMLKASWALGITNCIMFFFTAVLALLVGNRHQRKETVYVRETHTSRHGHRRSGSQSQRSRSHRSTSRRRQAYV